VAISIKYMGSKKSLARSIAAKISREHPRAAVLDVFAGMCAVGTELAPRHALLTNDLHSFASSIAQALFISRFTPSGPKSKQRSEFMDAFKKNQIALQEALAWRLSRERQALIAVRRMENWRKFRDFSDAELARHAPTNIKGLFNIADYKKRPKMFPYCLVSSYFSGAYFGLQQAIDIDSLRYAIDSAPEKFRARYLAALIQAASHCAATPGHFAQFLVARDKQNTNYIARIRSRSVLDRFNQALEQFPKIDCFDRRRNRVFREDATVLLRDHASLLPKENFVIYADPPYSRAQYSRYYHVLETLVLYDYPACDSKGRYRDSRFQTDFSRKLGVIGAMKAFVGAAAQTGAPLYISYPRNGLLQKAGGDLRDILRDKYTSVKLTAHPLSHSTLGGAPGTASVEVLEDVYYAGWKQSPFSSS
jgi:adenine-specific DNA-methyltransferase